MAPSSSPCCLAHCPHFPVIRLSHSTLQTPQTPPLARNIITFFPRVGSTGAPHQTLALSPFQFLSPDLRSAPTHKPGLCHDALLLFYFLSFNPPWLSSEGKYLTDAFCMTVLCPPKSLSGLRDHRGLAPLGDQENDLGPSEVQTVCVSPEIWPYLSESRHNFLDWGRELFQELSSCWFPLSLPEGWACLDPLSRSPSANKSLGDH